MNYYYIPIKTSDALPWAKATVYKIQLVREEEKTKAISKIRKMRNWLRKVNTVEKATVLYEKDYWSARTNVENLYKDIEEELHKLISNMETIKPKTVFVSKSIANVLTIGKNILNKNNAG
jgi:hypothetical protein